jgi:hypothetical protein
MTDKVNEGEPPIGDESQMAKASGLNNSVLGGFARTTAKRFAEYKSSAKENEGKNGPVATAPSNRHSRHDWLERLFDLFGQYAIEVNKLVEDEHLVTTCHRPSEEPSDNPLISPMQGCVSTKYWQLTVRLQADGIAGYLLPMSMEKTFLRDESLFERIFLIESPGDENAAVWSFDNKPTEFFQLPDLAKRFFGSLIEIARMEDISDFDAVAEQSAEQYAATNAPPAIPDLPPIPAFEVEDSAAVNEAKFKDLLTHASNVASNAVSGATALEPAAHDANAEPALDLMKLEAQAESVRKTNKAKSGSGDLATKTLDSYALLDFEDAETYYSEYRLTPASEVPVPQPVESLFTRESMPPPDVEIDATFESAAALAAQELAIAEAQRLAAEKAELMAAAALAEAEIAEADAAEEAAALQKEAELVRAAEEARAEAEKAEQAEQARVHQARVEEEARVEAERAEQERAEEEARAEAERAEQAKAEEAARAEAERAEQARVEEEARAEAERAEQARAEEEARAEEATRADEAARAEAERAEEERIQEEAKAEAERIERAKVEAEAHSMAAGVEQAPREAASSAQTEAVPDTSIADDLEPVISPVSWESAPVSWEHAEVPVESVAEHSLEDAASDHAALNNQPFPLSTQSAPPGDVAPGVAVGPITSEESSESIEPVIPTPVITRVTMPAPVEAVAPDVVPPSHDSELAFPRAEDVHAYRRDDNLDLLTPSDVDMSAQVLDDEQDDREIADALLAVTEVEAPPIKESLTRRELSSEVQKLAAKLQQTSSDLIDTFSRKAKELSSHANSQDIPKGPKPLITPVTASTDQPVDRDGWRLFTPDQSALLAAANEQAHESAGTFTDIPEDSEFLLSDSEASEVTGVHEEQPLEATQIASPGDSSSEAYYAQQMSTEMAEAEELHSTFMQAEKFANDNAESAPEPSSPSSEETPNVEIGEPEVEAVIEPTSLSHGEEQSPSVVDETVTAAVQPVETSEITTESSVSEKPAHLETFRRPSQKESKKFHPYSVSAEAAEQESSKFAQKDSGDQTAAKKPKTFFESLQSTAIRRQSSQANQNKETSNNPQEIIMPKTDEMSVVAAIEMMRHSVERELENVAEVGSRAFQDQDMDTVERAMKRTRRIREFKEQLLPALEAWNTLGREEP